ncbi:MAG: AAA family ATPase [Pseudomonadota bacterium]
MKPEDQQSTDVANTPEPADPAPGMMAASQDLSLTIAAATSKDTGRGIVRVPAPLLGSLGLRAGDTVALGATRTIHARALPAPSNAAPDACTLDLWQRQSLGSTLGDTVSLRPCKLPLAVSLKVELSAPLGHAATGRIMRQLTEELAEVPVTEGDVLSLPGVMHPVEITVLECVPSPAARISAETKISIEDELSAGPPGFDGVGGLGPQIAKIREMVELPLNRPDLFSHLGLTPPRGVLFTGPPGSGKTLLARAVAEQIDAAFFQINGPEIVSKHYGDSEQKLREVFQSASKRSPAIIFIDEIDAIAPKREALSGEKQLERRVVAQLLTLLDGLGDRGQVVVMAATNLPHAVDPALRRPGRFDRELTFPAPDRAGRLEILRVHLANAPLASDVDLDTIAAQTHGYVGADLAALAREAGLAALARTARSAGSQSRIEPQDLIISPEDLDRAVGVTSPSTLRETQVETPEVTWSDIGGLDDVKQVLVESVIWPLTHQAKFSAMGVSPPSGVLLSGPPGVGKTLLARGIAAESGVNLIPVRGTTILSEFLGQAERAVAEVFAKARHAAPCILFLDEIDAIAPIRGSADPALSRIVAQLLVEIDGLTENKGVFLLGATNRSDAIDPALLRPGRFDQVVPIGAPDLAARADVLAVQCRRLPLATEVDLDRLAADTEGWTCAELASLSQTAARGALRRWVTSGAQPELDAVMRIEVRDFQDALQQISQHQHRRQEQTE